MGRVDVGQVAIVEIVVGASETAGQKGQTSKGVMEDAVSGIGAAQVLLGAPIGVTAADRGTGPEVVEDPEGLEAVSKEERRP